MANGYDGDIQLSVSLSPKDIRSSAQDLSKQIENIFEKSAGKELDTKFQRLQVQMSKSVTKARELQNAMEELEKTEVPTEEYAEIQKQIDKARDSLVKLLDKQQKFIETGGDTKSKTYLGMQYDVEELRQTIEFAEGELQELVETGAAFKLGSDTAQYDQLASKLGDVNNTLKTQITAYGELEDAEEGVAAETNNRLAPAFDKVKNLTVSIAQGAFNLMKKGLSSLVNKFKQAGTAASKFAGKLNFTRILGYAVGLRGLSSVFNHLRSSITQGITAMAKMNGGMNSTNAMMTKLLSTFNLLKGSLATAFAPIITVVGPILNSFMQQLANVITMIGMFIAKLTGAKSFVRATYKATDFATSGDKGGGSKGKSPQQKYEEAVKKAQERYDKAVARVTKSNEKKEAKAAERNAENMAKAEKKQAKAAEELAKKQEKANNKLAAFDDLNVLGKDDTDEYIDELEDLKEIQADLAEMPELELPNLEDYLGGGGGGGAGDPFGLEEIPLDGIEWNWDDLKAKAEELGREIANKLNKIFQNEQLAKDIGHNIAELLNTALHFAYGFIDQLDWRQMGRWFGTLVKEGIETFEWGLLGETIGLFLNGVADSILGFFERYPVGLIGQKISDMFNRAILTIDPIKIGTAVNEVLKAPLIELSTFLKATNWELLGKQLKTFFLNALQSKALNGESLGATIGDLLAKAINAGVDLLLSVEPTAVISALIAFFSDIFKKAFAGIDWWDVVKLLFGSHGLVDALLTGFVQAIAEVADAIYNLLPEPIAKALGVDEFRQELELMREGAISAFDELDGTFEDLKWKLDLVAEGTTYNKDQLMAFAETGEFTGQQIDKIIQGMIDFANQSGQSLDLAKLGLEGYNGSWDLFVARQELRNATVKQGIQEQGKVIEETSDKIDNRFKTTAERAAEFTRSSQINLQTAQTDMNDYSTNTNTALEGVQTKSEETATSVETMAFDINTNLENTTIAIDEWYNNLLETYFSYDVWYTMLQEGMLTALEEALTVGWVEKWDTIIKDWWEVHVKPWFSNEKWNGDIYTPWEQFRDTKWKALIKWWDDSMKNWWEEHVIPWFKEEKWKEQFEHIHKVAKEVAEATHKDVTEWVQQIEDFVVASCDTMIAKAEDLIAKLEEAIALASQLAEMGGGSGGFSASAPTGSSSVSSGGSSQGGGGGGRNFMPRLDIMHFEDNLGMSAFSFPELATGAVIPPNNKFLAVLGDQQSGYNIETPLATMVEAFRSVMDEYLTPNQNHVTMELDGETFARLALPHMMDEMHRQGYNTEIIEGI